MLMMPHVLNHYQNNIWYIINISFGDFATMETNGQNTLVCAT